MTFRHNEGWNDDDGQGPPEAERLPEAELQQEYLLSQLTMPEPLARLYDEANNASWPKMTAEELRDLISRLEEAEELYGPNFVLLIQTKITCVKTLLSFYNPPQELPPGGYEVL